MGRHFLVVTWEGGGNVNPVLGLARALIDAGHTVSALATASLADRLRDGGVSACTAAAGWLPDAAECRDTIEGDEPDVVVVDFMLTAALSAAEAATVPSVALVHTLLGATTTDDGTPHPMFMCGPVEALNEVRSGLGLDPVEAVGDLLSRCDRVLVTAPAALDVGTPGVNADHVGALFEGPGTDAGWVPPPGPGPLVVVSVGTAGDAERELALLATILEAVAPLRARVLVTIPDYLDAADLSPAENTVISGYVRHAAVMPHADLLVTHAGLGSVSVALAHGVPMVCLPLDREQPENGRAVERIGAGIALPADAAPQTVRAAIEQVLAGPRPTPIPPTPDAAVDILVSLIDT